jgi:cytochrome c oxidase subunit II
MNSGNFFLPPQKSTIANDVDLLFNFINVVSAIILLGIVVAIVFFIYKYKRKSENDTTSLVDHNTTLEVTWTAIPLFLIIYVFIWGFQDFMKMRTTPGDAYEIHVTGKSWFWEYTYANGGKVLNDLYVPAGRPVKLVMTSSDVLHSFYVPDYRIKQDVVPGRYTTVWFEVLEPGESIIFCTEYCGRSHSDMIGKVVALEQSEFDEWLRSSGGKPEDMPLAEWGEKLYTSSGCQACHSIDGSQIVGPTFKGSWESARQFEDGTSGVVDENYIRESIINPSAKIVKGYPPVMASYDGLFSDEDLSAIIEYIKSLK